MGRLEEIPLDFDLDQVTTRGWEIVHVQQSVEKRDRVREAYAATSKRERGGRERAQRHM